MLKGSIDSTDEYYAIRNLYEMYSNLWTESYITNIKAHDNNHLANLLLEHYMQTLKFNLDFNTLAYVRHVIIDIVKSYITVRATEQQLVNLFTTYKLTAKERLS